MVAIRRRLLVALLLVVVVGSALAYWSQQRIEAHARWATQTREALAFQEHMWSASAIVRGAVSNLTTRAWFNDELYYAEEAVNNLGFIDTSHSTRLMALWQAIQNLRGNLDTYLSSLNSTQQTALASNLHFIANKFENAYSNYINYTSTNDVTGPDFWYFGPAPPDETLLQQAVDLAVKMPGLPPAPPG